MWIIFSGAFGVIVPCSNYLGISLHDILCNNRLMDITGDDNCTANFTNRTCFQFTKHDFKYIFWMKIGMATLAGAASCLAILLIIFFKGYKKFVHRLVLYLSITALESSVTFVFQVLPVEDECDHLVLWNENFCIAAGFLVVYSIWAILLLTCWITLHIFVLAAFNRNLKSYKYEIVGVLTCHILPIFFSIVPLVTLKNDTLYGLAGAWCWIKLTDEDCNKYKAGVIEQFTLWYGPFMFFAILNCIAMLIVIVILYRRARGIHQPHQYREALKETVPLLVYPFIFNTLYCLGFANRVYYAVTEDAKFSLWMVHAFCDPCLPLFIPIAFLLHPNSLKKLNCKKLKTAANEWRHANSQQNHTHFVVSREDVCDTSLTERLVIRGSEDIASSYQSFLNIPTVKPQ